MIKKNKGKLILASLITLLPILAGLLLWDRLPAAFATHWGLDGQPDGWSSVPMAVFLPPVILVGVLWLCALLTEKEGSNRDRNQKPIGLVLWIIPVISNLSAAMTYSLALGAEYSVTMVMVLVIGLMFVVIGNYLPKCRYNFTLGIKLPWTFSSEENWNATHRFGGKVWMIGGAVIALSAFLPGDAGVVVMLCAMIILIAVPAVYSYRFYRKQKAAGEQVSIPPAVSNSKMGKISLVLVALLLIFVGVVMFTGDVDVSWGDSAFTLEASYWDPVTVAYGAVDSVEYRDENVDGSRTHGFGSARLLLGTFENEEFGYYVRYTYTGSDACVVLDVGGQILVIGMDSPEATRAVYEALLERIE